MALSDLGSLRSGTFLEGAAAAEGFAVGRAMRLARGGQPRGPAAQTLPLRDAIVNVRRDLGRLLATLPTAEAELFEPELRILDEIEPKLLSHGDEGRSPAEAIFEETSCGCTDLVIDLRERLLAAMGGLSEAELRAPTTYHESDMILLAEVVTPSIVAFLPKQVVAVVAALKDPTGARRDVGRTSHAAILARSRGLPLAYVSLEALSSIPNATWVGLEAIDGDARIWVDPGETFLQQAWRRIEADRNERLGSPSESLADLGIALRVNIASAHDDIPRSAQGVGVVRTEMMFAGSLYAPSESDQLAAILRVASKAHGAPVVVRLFDAGADKPLAWLGGNAGSARGIARLLQYPEVLSTQLRAIARAREQADIRALVPFVERAADLRAVRSVSASALALGAMIESPAAVDAIEAIVASADFVSIGTNDLTATALGLDRTASLPTADPRVLRLSRRAIRAAHAAGLEVTVCGEMASDERGARIAIGLGANALSLAPTRLANIRRSLGRMTVDACRDEAQRAIESEASGA